MARLVEDASRKVALERDQLGALMAELHQSVVVCNLDGRILLYNGRARALFRRLSRAPDSAGGAELIGLGRSIHAVIDRALIDHARETIERSIARGEAAASAQFVTTTPAGHLLQVSLAPVRSGDGDAPLSGYVLLLDDITDDYAAQSRRDHRLIQLTEASRASLASMQAALDMLDYPDLEPAERESFHAVVRDEVDAMSARLADLAADTSQDLLTRWPLQEMLGADLVTAAAQRIEAEAGQAVAGTEVDDGLWLSVDSFALTQALAFLAHRLGETPGRPPLSLRLAAARRLGLPRPALARRRRRRPPIRPAGRPRRWTSATAPRRSRRATSPSVTAASSGSSTTARAASSFFRFLLPLATGRGRRGRRDRAPGILRLRPLRRQRRDAGARRPAARRSSPSPSSTPRPPASTPPAATRSSRWAPSASSTAGCCAASASTSWSIPAAASPRRRSRSTASGRRWSAASRGSPRCCPPSTPSPPTPCSSATTSPSTCASCSSRRPPPASASTSPCSTPCCSRAWRSPTRPRTRSRRSRPASASPCPPVTPPPATP